MSTNISLPPVRVPLVDVTGCMTREWALWFLAMFERVGGVQGFSNQELWGDAVALQSYDELLGRIGTAEAMIRSTGVTDSALQDLLQRLAQVEAENRGLQQALQQVVLGDLPVPQQPAATTDTFDRITVRGDADLSTMRGYTKVAGGVAGSTAKLQVGGDTDIDGVLRVSGDVAAAGNISGDAIAASGALTVGAGATVAGALHSDTEITTTGGLTADAGVQTNGNVGCASVYASANVLAELFFSGGQQVVGSRKTGFTYPTPYAGQTMGASYSQSQVQATDNALKTVSAQVSALYSGLLAHGLIGA